MKRRSAGTVDAVNDELAFPGGQQRAHCVVGGRTWEGHTGTSQVRGVIPPRVKVVLKHINNFQRGKLH